jgi:hypothetical protein
MGSALRRMPYHGSSRPSSTLIAFFVAVPGPHLHDGVRPVVPAIAPMLRIWKTEFGCGWPQPRGSQERGSCALIRRTSEHLLVLTGRRCQKPNDAEHKETNPECVQNYAQDRWPPGIASSLRLNVHDNRSRDLGSRRMIDPFANTERQEAKSDRKSGDELLPKGGDGDQTACGGHNVPPAIGLKSIQVHETLLVARRGYSMSCLRPEVRFRGPTMTRFAVLNRELTY